MAKVTRSPQASESFVLQEKEKERTGFPPARE
jgi:hypothetical protein